PEMLSRAGYETLGVVSGADLSPAFGFDRGFHIYRYLNDRAAAEVVDAALELSRRAGGRSQFLFVHFFDPHWPYLPPRDFLERFGKRPPDISDLTRMVVERIPPGAPEEVEYLKNLYDGEVAYVDQHLGRLIQALQAAGLYDESLIVLTADHGEAFYEHELWQHSELLYEEVTHIPLVVKWPKGRHQGSVSRLVSQLNIFSTILEEAGLDFSYPDTPSLSRHVENGGEIAGPSMVLGEITWEPNPTRGALMKISLRTEELKYIATFAGEIGDEKFVSELLREELYDLSRDPLERENLLPQALGKIGLLRREVRRFLDEARRSKAAQQGQKIVLDEELIEQLKALGYLNP
ncbi:MAG: sulfatase-like hydrolase/transferase, partial [Acidobacteriota bacterium]